MFAVRIVAVLLFIETAYTINEPSECNISFIGQIRYCTVNNKPLFCQSVCPYQSARQHPPHHTHIP